MTDVTDSAVARDFDHHAKTFVRENANVYAALRAEAPVGHSESYGGFWVLSTYDDVFEVARDDATYSAEREVVIPDGGVGAGALIPLQSDPPNLERYRGILSPFFTPRALGPVAQWVAQRTDECIDQFIERGRADLVSELANPVPSGTTMHLLGLNPDDWRVFAEPLHLKSYAQPGTPENLEGLRRVTEFSELIVQEVDARIASPRDDMISAIAASEWNGIKTTREEAINLVRMVIFGGMDTVMAALSNTFVQLGRHPHLIRELDDNRELIPGAIEEFLRFDAPVQGFARSVTHDHEFRGHHLRQGDSVFMLWASANRDESVFGDNADQLDIRRSPNRHMTFGIGAHRCMGSTLARMELRIVLGRVLDRLPDFAVDLDNVDEPDTVGIVFGRRRVPITFTPGARQGVAS